MRNFLDTFNKVPNWIKLIFLIAIFIRIITIQIPPFQTDVSDWQNWAVRINQVGLMNFYSPGFFADYFPFFYLLLLIISKPFALLLGIQSLYSNDFILYFKLVNNFFDILTSIVIFLILNKHRRNLSFLAVSLYLVNPAIIFNTSVWGQTDSIPTFFWIYSVYLLNERLMPTLGLSFATFSLLIKPLILPALPIMFLKSASIFNAKKLLRALFVSGLLGLIILLLFFPQIQIHEIYQRFSGSLGTYPYTSVNAFNFWGVVGFWKSDSILFAGISYQMWGYVIFALLFLLCILAYIKSKKDNQVLYLFYTLSSLSFFLFLTRMHERHIFPVFVFLLVSAILTKSRILLSLYFLLSVTFLANLFYSYYYYEFIYSNKQSIFEPIFYFVSNTSKTFSVLNVASYILIIFYYINLALGKRGYGKTHKKIK